MVQDTIKDIIMWRPIIIATAIVVAIYFVSDMLSGQSLLFSGFLLAGIAVGFMVGGSIKAGLINGAITGVIAGIITTIMLIIYLLIEGLSASVMGSIGGTLAMYIAVEIVIAIAGGAIGFFINSETEFANEEDDESEIPEN